MKSSTSVFNPLRQKFGKLIGRLWDQLVTPYPALVVTDQQQARLLLSLLVAGFPFMLSFGLLDLFFQGGHFLFGYIFFDVALPVLIVLAWCFGKTNYFRVGAWLVVIAPAAVISMVIFVLDPTDVGTFVLYYLVFCPLLASLLLNVRATILMMLVNLVIVVAGISHISYWNVARMSDEILYNILVPILLAVSAIVRQRYLEQLKHAEREARTAREEAEHSNNVKSVFLATMSHELRTPLNVILNFTELLSLPTLGSVNDRQRDALKTVHDSGSHLLGLINDVLDIARIEADGMQLAVESDVNLNQEMETVVASAQVLVKEKPIQLILDIDAHLPLIACDRRRIRQVMFNLISNAVKFTDAGNITFSIKAKPEHVLFVVSDTGPGIAFEDQSIIFEPFKQADAGLKYGGTGLGLPISKSIMDAHGGKLWVESEKGDGATFFATLPLASK